MENTTKDFELLNFKTIQEERLKNAFIENLKQLKHNIKYLGESDAQVRGATFHRLLWRERYPSAKRRFYIGVMVPGKGSGAHFMFSHCLAQYASRSEMYADATAFLVFNDTLKLSNIFGHTPAIAYNIDELIAYIHITHPISDANSYGKLACKLRNFGRACQSIREAMEIQHAKNSG